MKNKIIKEIDIDSFLNDLEKVTQSHIKYNSDNKKFFVRRRSKKNVRLIRGIECSFCGLIPNKAFLECSFDEFQRKDSSATVNLYFIDGNKKTTFDLVYENDETKICCNNCSSKKEKKNHKIHLEKNQFQLSNELSISFIKFGYGLEKIIMTPLEIQYVVLKNGIESTFIKNDFNDDLKKIIEQFEKNSGY